jgi:hypothetical protein
MRDPTHRDREPVRDQSIEEGRGERRRPRDARTTPTHLPPSSYASGIIVFASMVRIAPAANASTKATTSGDECWNSV